MHFGSRFWLTTSSYLGSSTKSVLILVSPFFSMLMFFLTSIFEFIFSLNSSISNSSCVWVIMLIGLTIILSLDFCYASASSFSLSFEKSLNSFLVNDLSRLILLLPSFSSLNIIWMGYIILLAIYSWAMNTCRYILSVGEKVLISFLEREAGSSLV